MEIPRKNPFLQPPAAVCDTLMSMDSDASQGQGPETSEDLQRQLSEIVEARTAELTEANQKFRAEIAERKAAEKALRASEEQFRLVFENTRDAIFWADPETGRIFLCNKAAEVLVGRPRDQIVGQHQTFLHPPDQSEQYANVFKNRVGEPGRMNTEGEVIRASGERVPVQISGSVVSIGGRSVVQGIFRDVTRREADRQALADAHHKLADARERERRHLSRELHDSIGQKIVAMHLKIQLACDEAPAGALADALRGLAEQCEGLVHEIRHISRGLYPSALEALGLGAALRDLLAECESAGIRTVLHCDDYERHPGGASQVEIALFRIAQEAVNNSVRHARASQIQVSLGAAGEQMVMCVKDDGDGFDPATAPRGLGLSSMQERADVLGGDLRITSRPGQTRVEIRLPIRPPSPT